MKSDTHCFQKIRLLPVLLFLLACNHPKPPIADVIPAKQVIRGVNYTDPYKYLENSKDPKTVSYIRAENEYAEHYFDHLSRLKNNLLKEFEGQDNYEKQRGSIPMLTGKYFYYKRIPDGKTFPVRYRKMKGNYAKEEIVLDENLLIKGVENFNMDQFLVSPDNSMFLFTYKVNNGRHRLIIKNFGNQFCIDSITGDISSTAWAGDGKSIVYVKDEKEVLIHQLGTAVEHDKTIYLEKRDDLHVDVNLSASAKYIFITSRNNESTEWSYLPSDLKSLRPMLIESFREGRTYFVDHYGSDFFLILSDQGTPDRKLFKSFISRPSEKNWITVLEGKDGYHIDGYNVIEEKYLLLLEKKI